MKTYTATRPHLCFCGCDTIIKEGEKMIISREGEGLFYKLGHEPKPDAGNSAAADQEAAASRGQ